MCLLAPLLIHLLFGLSQKDGRQPQALANAIIAFGSNIENIGALAPAIQLMATKHCGLQVLPQHYGIVHSNLMTAVGTVLADQLTPDITTACEQMHRGNRIS
jgi:nitric oxide dioxygenase